MADEDQEQRTEAPSERRLAQAFEEGDIPLSRDLVSTGAFALGVIALFSFAHSLESRLVSLVSQTLTLSPTTPFQSIPSIVIPIIVPLLGVVLSVALGALALTFRN